MPLNRLVLLHVINRTSRTLPTALKKSSKSLARIRCDNCITKTVLASLSSGLSSSRGDDPLLYPRPIGERPRLGKGSLTDGGEGDRFLERDRLRSLLRLLRSLSR